MDPIAHNPLQCIQFMALHIPIALHPDFLSNSANSEQLSDWIGALMEVVAPPSVTTFFTCIAVNALIELRGWVMGDSTSAAGNAKEGPTQQKVKRLNSLLFGVDLAFSKGDTDTALGLRLRLLGFLESQCQTAEDVVYVEPIQRKVLQKLNLATLVDR